MIRSARILIVDDHSFIREGLTKVLADRFFGSTIHGASDAVEAKRALGAVPYDLVIVDVALPGQGGIDLLEYIGHSHPDSRVLVMSGHPEEQFAVRAFRAGAYGCLFKGELDCVRLVYEAAKLILAGCKFISATSSQLLAAELDRDSSGPLHQTLSNREYDILVRIGSGIAPNGIAAALNISVKTVSTYRGRLLFKMHMSTNASLVEYAIRNGLVQNVCHTGDSRASPPPKS